MIDKLEMFIALAQERHFGRAAKLCNVAQPSLSAAIMQLEEQLGVQLVFRGTRFQGLTPEGARVLEWARRIVGDARTMRDEMLSLRKGLSGNLRLGVIPTAMPMVSDLTSPFLFQHPNVKVTILARSSAEIMQGIEELTLDGGITYLDNEPLGRVTQVPLYSEFYCLFVGKNHPLAWEKHVTWADLAGLNLCLLTGDMQNRRIINQYLAEAGLDVLPNVESNSTIVLITHVLTGKWASILPRKLADLFSDSGTACAIPIIAPEAEHLVGLIAAHREPHTPLIAKLLDAARKLGRVKL